MLHKRSIHAGYYGDGPPHWTVSKGKPWEAPSQTARDASLQRNAAVKKLLWHAKRNGDNKVFKLADTIANCRQNHRCLSGASPLCVRARQRWLVSTSMSALADLKGPDGTHAQILSLVPDFGRVPMGQLAEFDMENFRRSALNALIASNVKRFCLGIDMSLNHDEGDFANAYWQFQLWGFFQEPESSWRESLKTG
jgi:hypothetical protein